MAQVLLLNPTYRGRASNICMPSGLLCVAATLKANGYNVQILDSYVYQYSPREAFRQYLGWTLIFLGLEEFLHLTIFGKNLFHCSDKSKGVTVDQNRKVLRLCKEVGLYASPTMVLGMPSETLDTIEETKAFLIEEDVQTFGEFFATAYPASALFEYAISKGLIQNIDAYMLKVGNASKLIINYTALSNDTLRRKLLEVARAVLYA